MTRSGCPPFGMFSLLLSIATGSTIVPAQVAGQSLGGRVAAAARTERAPRLDGTLEASVWKLAPIIGDFRQREPLETSRSSHPLRFSACLFWHSLLWRRSGSDRGHAVA